MPTYSSGDWHVKPGREKEFEEVWREMATWSGTQFSTGGWAKLLRDKEDPSHFRSVGQWGDDQAVENWRQSDGFKERMANIRELLDDMHIYILDVAVEVE